MKRLMSEQIVTVLFAVFISLILVSCGGNALPSAPGRTVPPSNQFTPSVEPSISEFPVETMPKEVVSPTEKPTESPASPIIPQHEEKNNKRKLTEKERNSLSMLNYLAITAEKIRTSKDSRLLLDDIYTSLLNDINPSAIDEKTQEHLENLRDIIKSYINISVKRDRLQYIYNQDKAAIIRSAVPNPLAILSMINSFNWRGLATSVVYTVVDSYTNYKNATDAVDQGFLMSGWELNDEETAAIYKNRDRAFNYMVDIVREYSIDGKLTLNEKEIENFTKICTIESVYEKIGRLESEEKTYKLLGNYWLELADCYYETEQYKECLNCIEKYNELATEIYRNDYNYVQILPKAIVAAQKIYADNAADYITNIKKFADAIDKNTTKENWSVRYFAAQVYLDLYAGKKDTTHLKKAYDIAYDNFIILLDEQRKLNNTYLEDVKAVEIEEPDYRFLNEKKKKEAKQDYKNKQKQLKVFNKALRDARKTELPALYEPLILNCELLFSLVQKQETSINDFKSKIEKILKNDENVVFLVAPINDRYSFSVVKSNYSIEISKKEIVIPVDLLSAKAKIVVTVTDDGEPVTFDDCIITEVERKGTTIDTFYAHYSSKKMKNYKWTADSKVEVKIICEKEDEPMVFRFKVMEYKDNWAFPDKVVFGAE